MKVLFVSSGNSKQGISPIIKNQGISLIDQGLEVDFFTIKGKGFNGYIKNIGKLKKYLKNKDYDIVQVHYSLSAFVATLAGAKPLVVSLMGSDVNSSGIYNRLIKLFHKIYWSKVIVKSTDMLNTISISPSIVVPNGVNMEIMKPLNKENAREILGWDKKSKHVLFAANPKRFEKNYKLAEKAFGLVNNDNIQFHYFDNVSYEKVIDYFNASDVVLLTSLWEGSPNVIKEAMACNIPIVSTDVGDVREVIGNTQGCYITTFEPEDVANKIKKALDFGKRTTGRKDIQHLESGIIAKKIIKIYKSVLTK